MAEYKERKALREAFDNADADVVEEYEDGDCDWGFGRQNILEVINSVPSADVATVRHGRWDSSGKYRFIDNSVAVRCTECGCSLSEPEYRKYVWNYCPVCGAKMDLEV